MSENASRDGDRNPTLLAVSNTNLTSPVKVAADPVTHRLLVNLSGGLSTANFITETFTSTNGQTTFAASYSIDNDQGMWVNGSRQRPATNYTISGQSYVLSSGIPSANDVIISYITNNP